MAKLDKKQPYGEVSGVLECGTRYFQGDKRFDVNENEIVDPDAPAAPVTKGKRKAAEQVPPAEPAPDEQLKDLT